MAFFSNFFAILNPFNWHISQPSSRRRRTDRYQLRSHQRDFSLPIQVRYLGPGAGTKRRNDSAIVTVRNKRLRLHGLDHPIFHQLTESASEMEFGELDALCNLVDANSPSYKLEFSEDGDSENEADLALSTNADNDIDADYARSSPSYASFVHSRRFYATPSPIRDIPCDPPKGKKMTADRRRYLLLDSVKSITATWPAHDTRLFMHFRLRSIEPIFPPSLAADFSAFPSRLFTRTDAEALLSPLGRDGVEGRHARQVEILKVLIDLSAYHRDLVKQQWKKSPKRMARTETVTMNAVERYLRWTLRDGGEDYESEEFMGNVVVHKSPFLVGASAEDDGLDEASESLAREMKEIKGDWEQRVKDIAGDELVEDGEELTPPPVFGILCQGAVIALVSLIDDEKEKKEEPRVMGSSHLVPEAAANRISAEDMEADLRPLYSQRGEGLGEDVDREGLETGMYDIKEYLRTLAVYNFTNSSEQDVWIAVSIAMFLTSARNELLDHLDAEDEWIRVYGDGRATGAPTGGETGDGSIDRDDGEETGSGPSEVSVERINSEIKQKIGISEAVVESVE